LFEIFVHAFAQGHATAPQAERLHEFTVAFDAFSPLAGRTLDGEGLGFQDTPVSGFDKDFVLHTRLALDFGDGCHGITSSKTR